MVKVHINSVLSTPTARFMSFDIKDFYLGTPMARYEYVRIPVKFIPPDIMAQYQLQLLLKGMYGLLQAGILAYKQLAQHLSAHGYFATSNTPGLFRHRTQPITCSLVVDDFGVKYAGVHNAQHLIDTLKALYTLTTDWGGTLYCGLTLTCRQSRQLFYETSLSLTPSSHAPALSTGPTHNIFLNRHLKCKDMNIFLNMLSF
jgi:hypothetical protein